MTTVEVMLVDGGDATVEGTGRVEVSRGTGEAKEPDMPVRTKKVEFWV